MSGSDDHLNDLVAALTPQQAVRFRQLYAGWREVSNGAGVDEATADEILLSAVLPDILVDAERHRSEVAARMQEAQGCTGALAPGRQVTPVGRVPLSIGGPGVANGPR